MATKKVVWLQGLLGFLRAKQQKPSNIYQDNHLTIALVGNGQMPCKTKYIKVCFYYTKDKITNNIVSLEYCSTNRRIVNALIKTLVLELFE